MGYANPDILVCPEWVSENSGDQDMVVVDCPWDYYSYTRAHIPGALCRPGHSYVKALDGDGSKTVLVAGEDEVQKLLHNLGIGEDSTVVLYDDWGSIFATRLWWVLKYYGFENAKVLDGGWQSWVDAGLPISYESVQAKEVQNPLRLIPNQDMLITADELLQKYKESGCQVLDVRSEDEYYGRADHGNKRVGHIPGATNTEWSLVLENSQDSEGVRKFRAAEDLEALLSNAGVDRGNEIVTHCQAAVRATLMAFALELVGYPRVRVYDGSMAEWANREDTPLEY